MIYCRYRLLNAIESRLDPPPVPKIILTATKDAEAGFYASQPLWRRAVKLAQDALTFLAPALVYGMSSSVGRYRIKPKTVEGLAGVGNRKRVPRASWQP